MPIIYESVSERIKQLRTENNLTVYSVADIVGVSAPSISRYESGVMAPRKDVIEKYSKHFKVSPLWILGITNDKYDVGDVECKRVPIIGTIAAGVPIMAQEDITDYAWIASDISVDFALKVKGDSMINARIKDGDLAFIRIQSTIENGEIAAVMIDGEATLKRVLKTPVAIILHPENPAYKDVVYMHSEMSRLKILGRLKLVQFEVM